MKKLIRDGCDGKGDTWFVTLTFRESVEELGGLSEAFDICQRRFHGFLRYLQKWGYKFHYFRVTELQKRGTPHFHMVVNRVVFPGNVCDKTGLLREVFRDAWHRVGGGPQGFQRYYDETRKAAVQKARVGGKAACSYLAKYLSKMDVEELTRDTGRSIRKYSKSQGWCFVSYKKGWRWARQGRVTREVITEVALRCGCGDGYVLSENEQRKRWLALCDRENAWCAPLGLFDDCYYIGSYWQSIFKIGG